MAYEEGLAAVNGMHRAMANLARSVAKALQDGKVSPFEGIALGMQGMNFASTVMMVIQSGNKDEILHVLEHGVWVLDDEGLTSSPA